MNTTSKKIRIEMIKADVKIVEIASHLGITPSAVHQVVSGNRSTLRIREAIAKAVGKPVDELWPSMDKAA